MRLKSASRPCPTASWSSTPGQPGPRTTGISPAGAAMAPSWRMRASTRRLAGKVLRRVRAFEEVERDATTAAGGSAGGRTGALVAAGILGNDEDIQAGKRLGVRGESAVGCGHQDAAELIVETRGADLGDAWSRRRVRLCRHAESGQAWRRFRRPQWLRGDRVERGRVRGMAEAGHLLFRGATRDERGGAGRAEEPVRRQNIGICVTGPLAGEDADAEADADALRGRTSTRDSSMPSEVRRYTASK